MTPRGKVRWAPVQIAWGLTVLLSLAAGGLVLGLRSFDRLPGQVHLPLIVLVGLMTLAERYRLHLHFGRSTHSVTLAELVTGLALLTASPVNVVLARVIGGGLAQARLHRKNPLKLTFNIANGAVDTAIGVAAFHLYVRAVGAGDTALLYVGAFGAIVVGSIVGSVMVWLVIRIVERSSTPGDLLGTLKANVPIAVANTGLGLSIALALRLEPSLAWLPLIPLGVLVLAYRAYAQQWQHRDALDFLYETACEVQAVADLETSLVELVARARGHLRAGMADLTVVPAADATSSIVVSVGPGDARETRARSVPDLPLEVRELLFNRAETEGHSAAEIWIREDVGRGGSLLLRVREPLATLDHFDDTDTEVLRSLIRLAVTSVDRAELDDLKHAFLSAVSHELRTPLAVVMGTAATLKGRRDQLSQPQTDLLVDRLDVQARRLDRLLSDLLDLDRLSRGLVEPHRRLVDLAAITERVRRALEITTHEVDIAVDTLLADVDASLTERIIENLIKNAAKYSPPQTTIRVDLFRREDGVVIAVEDEGDGIPEHMRASVLDPFVRLHHDHPQPGTGIGLTLVRRFAQLHGGDVSIQDAEQGGTRVVVTLKDDMADRNVTPQELAAAVALEDA